MQRLRPGQGITLEFLGWIGCAARVRGAQSMLGLHQGPYSVKVIFVTQGNGVDVNFVTQGPYSVKVNFALVVGLRMLRSRFAVLAAMVQSGSCSWMRRFGVNLPPVIGDVYATLFPMHSKQERIVYSGERYAFKVSWA